MSIINCDVKNCMFNMMRKCYKKNISVSGLLANTSSNTFCESFSEGSDMVEFSSFDDQNQMVYCNAINCSHLSSGICKAREIKISGGKIKIASESKCNTFEEE